MVYATLLSEEDLSRFRTKQCKRLLNGGCNFGLDRCQYSHNEFWNRRCPFYLSDSSFIRYITVMCPNIETKSDGSINSVCLRGGECPFAHSTEEILYHPLFYKTKRCEDYKKGSCNTYYCPYVHGLAETRVPGTYKLPFTNGIDIPNIPNIIIVDKIDISNKNNNNLTHNTKYGKHTHTANKADSHFDTRSKNNSGTKGYTTDSYYQKKLDCETTSAFSTIDSIFDKNDVFKNTCDKIEMGEMNENNLVKCSKDDINFNMYLEKNNFEKTNGSINGNNNYGTTISNEACSTNFCKNSNSEMNIKFSNCNIKDNNMPWYKNNNKYSSINSDNLNEFLPGKNSYTHGSQNYLSYSAMNVNDSFNTHNNNGSFHEKLNSDDRSISSKYTQNAHKMNNNYNMGKHKQNYSICSTTTHEICFNEHEGTSNELIDGDEEYMENDDHLNEFIFKNKNMDKLLNNGRNSSSGIDRRDANISCNTFESIKGGNIDNSDNCGENNELSLLEVIKYLKILYEKISKGNVAFTHEQWGSVAQITYDIIGIIEFNKAIKIKNFQNDLKTTTYNDINKAHIFETSKNFTINKNTNIKGEQIEEHQYGGAKNIQINENEKNRNAKLGINGRTIIEEIEMINKQNNSNDNIVNTNNSEQNVSLENEINNVASSDSMMSTVTMNMLNFSVDNSNEIDDKNKIAHQYKDTKTKKDNFNGNLNLDLLNARDHVQTNFSDLNNDQNALKDAHFLDYYNFNPNAINFGDEKDISEKISPQQPLVSFFAFLSE
ncbi:zinc finger protein, putative [Plasmodium vinckei lentum]|uniref:Zinc finger protein, putative n=1 Tax=Plasmodium vinckei lentum TaxID=138297 RepID=A0A6V7SSJ0_PLAVN|nr:zinc finger protein, putative [Plasmodium vinckei lentum]